MDEIKTNEQILQEMRERHLRLGRYSDFDRFDGQPTNNPKFRHRCTRCKKRRYEQDMQLTGYVSHSNFKISLDWKCKQCPI